MTARVALLATALLGGCCRRALVAGLESTDPLLAAIGDEWRLLGQAWERAGIAGTFPGDLAGRPAVLVDAIALLE